MALQSQVAEGIDAVIVDSVLAIRQGLTHPESGANKTDSDLIKDPVNGDGASHHSREDVVPFTINGVPITEYTYGALM